MAGSSRSNKTARVGGFDSGQPWWIAHVKRQKKRAKAAKQARKKNRRK